MPSSVRLLHLLLLGIFVLAAGGLWWSLRSQRLASTPLQPPRTQLQKSAPNLVPVVLDNTVTFQAKTAELTTTTQNYPDHDILPTACQPVQNLFGYSGADEAQYESLFTWDTSTLSTQSTPKQEKFSSLASSLEELAQLSDPNTHRLPLQGDWDESRFFPWLDPACGLGEMAFYPVLIEAVSLDSYDQAWYLESFEGSGIPELPATRRLFARRGTRWIVVSEQRSAESELQQPYDTLQQEVNATCSTSQALLPDIITCLSQLWFSQYRADGAAQAWRESVTSRLIF